MQMIGPIPIVMTRIFFSFFQKGGNGRRNTLPMGGVKSNSHTTHTPLSHYDKEIDIRISELSKSFAVVLKVILENQMT